MSMSASRAMCGDDIRIQGGEVWRCSINRVDQRKSHRHKAVPGPTLAMPIRITRSVAPSAWLHCVGPCFAL